MSKRVMSRRPSAKHTLGRWWFLLGMVFGVGFLLASAPGCTDSCADLQDVCDLCSDASYRAACVDTVARKNQTLCGDNIANYRQFCQGGQGGATASSSTGGGATAASGSAASGSAGGGSAGGSGGSAGGGS